MSPKRAIGILLTATLILSGSVASAKKKKQPAAESGGEAQPEGEQPAGDQPSKVLERAFKLYDGEDFWSSTIELSKVIEGESGDSEPNKQKAEFWMGKALYNLKFYSASLSYFDRIVQKGPSHAYYNATLKWLASLSRTLPDSTGILEKIGKYNRAELDQPALEKVRDELYFLLGKYYYQKGQFKEAVEAGFAFAFWCGAGGCEEKIKEETRATMRCIPLDPAAVMGGVGASNSGTCVYCGAPATDRAIFARAY